uniref:Uncharacterized protein n=1 Tax=Anguilla anguilla TaxID=7936 RepID=A0A0E9V7C1_ANGAN
MSTLSNYKQTNKETSHKYFQIFRHCFSASFRSNNDWTAFLKSSLPLSLGNGFSG